jgi:3-isopropylmalate/(R)-2-methylmalate dehydratase small subunit
MNIGLLLVECKVEVNERERIEVNTETGKVKNLSTGKEFTFPQYPPFIAQLMECGGLVNMVKEGKF